LLKVIELQGLVVVLPLVAVAAHAESLVVLPLSLSANDEAMPVPAPV
jgi:hypothetical protein